MHDIILTMLASVLGVASIVGLGVAGLGPLAAGAALLVVLTGAVGVGVGRTMAGLLRQTETVLPAVVATSPARQRSAARPAADHVLA